MPRLLVILLPLLLLATACYESDKQGSDFPHGRAVIDTGDDSVLIDVEIADTDERRALGLMNRESLERNSGMVFVFFRDTTGSFYMKDTLIPLSIAFFDVRGRIIDIQDMDPCDEQPCPTFSPAEPYFGALEVNQGAFENWGVSRGDTITLVHPSE